MLERITRGLCFKELGVSLPLDTPIKATRVTNFQNMARYSRFYSVKEVGIGRFVQFEYALLKASDSPLDTIWMYVFQGADARFCGDWQLGGRRAR
jgi:hypothetical protein